MYEFTSLYNVLSKLSLSVGFCFPGALHLQSKLYPILLLHCIVSTIPMIYIMACNMLLYHTLGPYNIKLYGHTTVAIVTVFDTFYYLVRREGFKSLLCNFDKVTKEMLNSNFVCDNDVNYILNRARTFNYCVKYYVIVVSLQVVCTTTVSYVLRYAFERHFLFVEVPYSVESEYAFHITAILIMMSGLHACLKTVCSWTVMFLILYHITFYLKILKKGLEDFDSTAKNYYYCNFVYNTDIICGLRNWVDLHQKILSLISQFNKLYSPLLLIHLLNFYGSALFYVFAVTEQKEDLYVSLQTLVFVAIEMVVFLALCTIGNELTHWSGKIFQNGYIVIHFSEYKAVSRCGLIAGEVANRPVIVSVFGSEYFNLTLDVFLWMVKSMASFYVGLSQIETLNKNYDRG